MEKTAGGQREVRLLAEYAHLYEGVPVDTWISAAEWAGAIVARSQRARLLSQYQRTFNPHHFEFRGGERRLPDKRNTRTRAGDR